MSKMIEIIVYSLFIAILFIISYEDLKKGKIRNNLLIALFLLATGALIYRGITYGFSVSILYQILFSSLISSLLWFTGFWPSGDAKLFIACSVFLSSLLPASLLPNTFNIFTLNIFLPFFLFYLFFLPIKTNKGEVKKAFKRAFSGYEIFLISTIFFGLVWIIVQFFSFLGLPTNFFVYLFVIFLIIEVVNKISPFNLEFFYVLCAIIRVFLDYRTIYTTTFWLDFLKMIVVYQFFVSFILKLSLNVNIRKVKIEELEPGMVLSEGIVKLKDKNKVTYEKREIGFLSLLLPKKNFIHNTTDDGLTLDDVKNIKNIKKEGKISFDELTVHKPIPFAVFILIGFVLTLFLKQNIVYFFKYLI
jgi:Flp pilus assembly protein protease CpaA